MIIKEFLILTPIEKKNYNHITMYTRISILYIIFFYNIIYFSLIIFFYGFNSYKFYFSFSHFMSSTISDSVHKIDKLDIFSCINDDFK
jgi:hypothetical protein